MEDDDQQLDLSTVPFQTNPLVHIRCFISIYSEFEIVYLRSKWGRGVYNLASCSTVRPPFAGSVLIASLSSPTTTSSTMVYSLTVFCFIWKLIKGLIIEKVIFVRIAMFGSSWPWTMSISTITRQSLALRGRCDPMLLACFMSLVGQGLSLDTWSSAVRRYSIEMYYAFSCCSLSKCGNSKHFF